MCIRPMSSFKLNKKYYISVEDEDFVIVREDKFCYYIVDSWGISTCEKNGIKPLFEIEKNYNEKEVKTAVVGFLTSIGIDL